MYPGLAVANSGRAFHIVVQGDQTIAKLIETLDALRTAAVSEILALQMRFAAPLTMMTALKAVVEARTQVKAGIAQHLQAQVVAALQQIHALLSTEQRQSLAYLIRTGTLAL